MESGKSVTELQGLQGFPRGRLSFAGLFSQLKTIPAIFGTLGFVFIRLLPSPPLLDQWFLTRGISQRETCLGRVDRVTAVGIDERNIFNI